MTEEEYNQFDTDFAHCRAPIAKKQTNACTTQPTRCSLQTSTKPIPLSILH